MKCRITAPRESTDVTVSMTLTTTEDRAIRLLRAVLKVLGRGHGIRCRKVLLTIDASASRTPRHPGGARQLQT
jgi:hypothetical protein